MNNGLTYATDIHVGSITNVFFSPSFEAFDRIIDCFFPLSCAWQKLS